MARHTKAEALATRESLLDAAEALFEAQGVSRTSLEQIAAAAAVTRGAVYWHFRNKTDLFNAMMSRAVLPLEAHWREPVDAADPLRHLQQAMFHVLRATATQPRLQRVFAIATQKVEITSDLGGIRDRHLQVREAFVAQIEQMLGLARDRGQLPRGLRIRPAAVGLHALIDGLVSNWMLDRQAFDLVRTGSAAIRAHVDGLAGSGTTTTLAAPRRAAATTRA